VFEIFRVLYPRSRPPLARLSLCALSHFRRQRFTTPRIKSGAGFLPENALVARSTSAAQSSPPTEHPSHPSVGVFLCAGSAKPKSPRLLSSSWMSFRRLAEFQAGNERNAEIQSAGSKKPVF